MTRTHIPGSGYYDANAYPCNPLADPGGAWPPLGGGATLPLALLAPSGSGAGRVVARTHIPATRP